MQQEQPTEQTSNRGKVHRNKTTTQNKTEKQNKKSIIKTTLIIHLSSHNHHPDQENQSDNPESECSIPLRTDTVLFQPGQCIDGDAADVVVVDVAVAVGVYVALFLISVCWRRGRRARKGDGKGKAYVSEQLNSRLNQPSQKQRNQNKAPKQHPRRLQFPLRQQHNHQNHKEQRQRAHGDCIGKQPWSP
jgi:hypothetical protein